jgi:5'(3')-deoxyribonucleotidase
MKHAPTTIAVDLDDVLFDFIGNFFDWHNRRHGTSLTEQDMVTDTLWEVWGGTKVQAQERIPQFWSEIDHLAVRPMPGAAEALQELKSSYRFAIVSARDPADSAQTTAWIEKYFPAIFAEVHLGISNPMAGSQPMSKAQVCQKIGASTLIDDQLVHIEECAKLGIRVLLFGMRPWNQRDGLPARVDRVDDWGSVSQALRATE